MIFCQQCTHPNPYHRDVCTACGTRLMIVTTTPSTTALGGAESLLRPTVEEHLLERVSMLEAELQRERERLDLLLELVHRQASGGLQDHALLDTLIEQLCENGAVQGSTLEERWRQRVAEHFDATEAQQQFDTFLEDVINAFSGEDLDLFSRLINTGADLFEQTNPKRGVRYFEKALMLDAANSPLASFVGEYYFRENKHALAREYLERSLVKNPRHHIAILMLGVICGDEGDLASAKRYLSRALKIKKDSFTAHFSLGRILVSEGRLREAISHLRQALLLKPTPEMHYLLGRTYLEDGRPDVALRHLRRAVELNPKFDAALYHLGLIYLSKENLLLAQEHFRAACEINPREARYRSALRARKAGRVAPLPLFGRTSIAGRKVVTSGDVRIAELLRDDLLEAEAGPSLEEKRHKR